MTTEKTYLAIGLMSGSSLDGVDAALTRTDGAFHNEALAVHYRPYPTAFKEKLMAMAKGDVPLSDVLRLERALTQHHVEAVKALLETPEAQNLGEKPAIIGFHGQTIRHMPHEGLTWQIGDASYLAEHTGLPVVADFRRRDMAAGGQGAPLIPLFHQVLFKQLGDTAKGMAVLNIGGVSNLTFTKPDGTIVSGDIGPGCSLMDQWAKLYMDKEFDEDGQLATSGTVHDSWLEQAIENEPFFHEPFPKSADRYQFDHLIPQNLSAADGAATLCALTAKTISDCFKTICPLDQQPTLWVAGGGAANPALMTALKKYVKEVKPIGEIGLNAGLLEAECFAWLAVRRLKGLPTSLPETTGANKPTIGGVLTA